MLMTISCHVLPIIQVFDMLCPIHDTTVKPVTRGHLKKCPYMTGVPSSQVHFNVKVYFGSQKMQFRHPNFDI